MGKGRINCSKDDKLHEHSSLFELAECIGDRGFRASVAVDPLPATAAVTPPVRPPYGGPVPSATPYDTTPVAGELQVVHKESGPTPAQLNAIARRGGSWRDAFLGTRAEASAIISALDDVETAGGWKLPPVPLDDDDWDMFPQERAWQRGELGPEWEAYRYGGTNGAAKLDEPTAMGGTMSTATPIGSPYSTMTSANPADSVNPMPDMEPGEGYRPMTPARVPAPMPPRPKSAGPSAADRMKMILPLVEKVREGYYATELGNGMSNDLKFFRLSRPKKGSYDGTTKIQWQIADNWRLALIIRPNGTFWKPDDLPFSMIDYLTNIVVDATGCARTYAKMIDKCCRCNTSLTDERSRHYGIGPECEKYWPHIIQLVDEEDELAREEEAKKWKA